MQIFCHFLPLTTLYSYNTIHPHLHPHKIFKTKLSNYTNQCSVSYYYEFSKEQDYICSKPEDSGMHLCSDLPPYRIGPMLCAGTFVRVLFKS